MHNVKKHFAQKYEKDPRILGVMALTGEQGSTQFIDGFDALLLVVTEQREPINFTSHYIKDRLHIQERWIHRDGLHHWILTGENRNIMQWILGGEIIMDRTGFLRDLRDNLIDYPMELREKKLLIEFSLFLRRYMQSKEYLQAGNVVDAYSNILETLHHWARICIIESGHHPEVTLWKQVHKINAGVYKMYEELQSSQETLEQRVQLVQLACDFSVLSKARDCCQVLIKLVESRKQPWTASEIKEHPAISELHVDIPLILKKLVERGILKEVAIAKDEALSLLEIQYTCA